MTKKPNSEESSSIFDTAMDRPLNEEENKNKTDNTNNENAKNEKSGNLKPTDKSVKKKLILAVVIVVIVALVLGYFVLLLLGKNGLRNKDFIISPTEEIDADVVDGNTVIYGGERYVFNDDVTTVLCMGVDSETLYTSERSYGHNGQADAIFLLALNRKNKKVTVTAIPRDTMADITVYAKEGSFIGTEKKQICLAYAYGNGTDKSCENVVKAVSRLFYGIQINSYYAIDLQAISAITDTVGGITVIANEDVMKADGSYLFRKGQTYNLLGKSAYDYLRSRNEDNADASYLRMERQTDYLKKFAEKFIEKTKKDITLPVTVYNKIKRNAVTDLDVSKLTYLVSELFSGEGKIEVEFYKLQGDILVGKDNYAEFYPDETKLFEHLLDVFYIKQE